MHLMSRLALGLASLAVSLAAAAGEMPFSQKAFDELRAAGKPVVLHVHASWCDVCKKQAEIVSSLVAQPQFKELTVMRADFDTDKAVQAQLKIGFRSTFVAFKGANEVGRSVGDSNPESIAALLRKPL
jgi:thiol-disulfide isomerase/thioredoxin